MNKKKKYDEIIELTDEELDEIFADDDFDNGEDSGEIRSLYEPVGMNRWAHLQGARRDAAVCAGPCEGRAIENLSPRI